MKCTVEWKLLCCWHICVLILSNWAVSIILTLINWSNQPEEQTTGNAHTLRPLLDELNTHKKQSDWRPNYWQFKRLPPLIGQSNCPQEAIRPKTNYWQFVGSTLSLSGKVTINKKQSGWRAHLVAIHGPTLYWAK